MSQTLTFETTIHFEREAKGRKAVHQGEASAVEPGRLPRVTKLMALAIRFEKLIGDGVVADYTELARLGHVTKARISQIMNLRLLAPDIQESILFMPRVVKGRDPITLRDLQSICLQPNWKKQRSIWATILGGLSTTGTTCQQMTTTG